ncbi:MAG: hypothetical protein H0X43_04420 [Nitrosospira sp.]|nr:hypothetical protein [Nitrosospira sp.]
MSEGVKTDTYFFFLSAHHRRARDNLLGHIKALSHEGANHGHIAAYCVALITTAGCYLECRINEFWLTALNNGMISPRLTENQKARFKEIARSSDWKMKKTLEKYQIALDTLGLPVFDKGASPYQGAKTLMSLRNEIVHHVPYETELLNNNRVSKRPKLEATLQTLIGKCPHEGIKSFFPENCLHQACAEWASKTSQMFVDEFLLRTGGNTKDSISGGIFRM